ncbi:MAG TPA: TIGR02270 family protein [Acetobacteraceae bacterium]
MAQPVIQDVLAQHAEGAGAVWIAREGLLRGAHARLPDLVRMDDRIDAYIDGLAVAGPGGLSLVLQSLGQEADGYFVACLAAVQMGERNGLHQVLRRALEGDPAGSEPWRGLVAALAWADRSKAEPVIRHLVTAASPRLRWLGFAAGGARRSWYGMDWEAPLTDPAPETRARAIRAAGELGRTELRARLVSGLADPDPECRFWSAWAAARMGAAEPLNTLADIAWNGLPRADQALDLLMRRLDVAGANAWLREFARLPGRQRDVIRAIGAIGDPFFIPWLVERMDDPACARLAGDAFSTITGADLRGCQLDRPAPEDFQSGPTDDPADANVAMDEDEHLPWPDAARIRPWWASHESRFTAGTGYFLGVAKAAADWLAILSDGFQRQRRTAALELAIRQPDRAMFETRARGRLQHRLLARVSH